MTVPRTRPRFAVPALLVLVTGLLSSAAVIPAEAAAPQLAIVTGVVTGPTGAPMYNAVIDAVSSDQGFGSGTGTSGAFSFQLPAGTYVFRFTAPNSGQLTPLQEWSYNAYQSADAATITLVAGQRLTLNTQLDTGGRISGNVRSGSGFPYKSLDVFAWRYNTTSANWQFVTMSAGPNGSFGFARLVPGTYVICFRDLVNGYQSQCLGTGGTTTFDNAQRLTIALGQTLAVGTVRLVK